MKSMICIIMKLQSIIVMVVLCLPENNCSSSKSTSKLSALTHGVRQQLSHDKSIKFQIFIGKNSFRRSL